MAATKINGIATQNQLDDNNECDYGYFYDIEDIPDKPIIVYVSFIEDDELDTNISTYKNQPKPTQIDGNKLINALISVSIITVIIIYILIII